MDVAVEVDRELLDSELVEELVANATKRDAQLRAVGLRGKVAAIDYQIDVNTLEHHEATSLPLNAIGRCRIELTASVPLDDYRKSPGTGSFVVIDRLTNITVGAGLIRGAAEGGSTGGEVDWQAFEIDFNALIRAIEDAQVAKLSE